MVAMMPLARALGTGSLWFVTTSTMATQGIKPETSRAEGVSFPAGRSKHAVDHRAGTVFSDCRKICPEMVVLPPGSYHRGAPFVYADPPPPYPPPETVVIERSLAIGRYDVTVGQFAAFIRATRPKEVGHCQTERGTVGPYRLDPEGNWRNPGFEQDDRHPVVCVTVADAKAYAAWLSKKTGHLYRLPTQREWEYAARAGETEDRTVLGTSDDPTCRYANVPDASYAAKYPQRPTDACDDGHIYTSPVGSYPSNRYGLYDMEGNVAQWTDTVFPGPGLTNVTAGGSWSRSPGHPASNQPAYDSKMRRPWIGFRLVRELR